jgi:hypothetical protein
MELAQNHSLWRALLLGMLDRQVLLPKLVFHYLKEHDTFTSLKVLGCKSEHSAVVGGKLEPAMCVVVLYWYSSVAVEIVSVTGHRRRLRDRKMDRLEY